MVVLLPKPDGGAQGIGLLEVIWKVLATIIDTRVTASIQFHDTLHGFCTRRGTGTAIIEAKIVQQLAAIQQVPFHEVFLDLWKAYDMLDHDRTLEIFEGYGIGPNIRSLLRSFWDQQLIIAKQGGYYGTPFTATRGCTQGCLFSPMTFNIVEDAIICYWLTLVIADNGVAFQGMGLTVAEKLVLFYADDGLIGAHDPVWLQHALDALVGLFRQVGLQTNTEKTKVLTCVPGAIHSSLSTEAYNSCRMTGEGDSYCTRQCHKVNCPECGMELAAGSLRQHLRSQHGTKMTTLSNEAVANLPPAAYRVSFPRYLTSLACPVEDCPGTASSRANLHLHFRNWHPHATVTILEEGTEPYPRCKLCELQISPRVLGRHLCTALCQEGHDRRHQRLAIETARKACEVVFTACGQPLESIDTFKYLGHFLSSMDSDWPALYENMAKAWQHWARVSIILARDGASPWVSGMFYKAIVQAVLLYGSETWVITQPMMKALEGFHHIVAHWLTG